MVQPRRNSCANDNRPVRRPIQQFNRRPNPAPALKAQNPIVAYERKTALAWIIPGLAIGGGAYALWESLPLISLLWPSLIIGTLLLLTVIQSEDGSRLRNISGLLMVAAFTTGLAAFLAQNGFSLIGMELTLLISMLALAVGWIFKSKPTVLLSAFASLIYLASFYPELGLTSGLTDQTSFLGAGLMPAVVLGQMALAHKLRSSVTLITSIAAAYILLGTLGKNMPLSPAIGLGFAIAASHYWFGKIEEEADKFGGSIHRTTAWIIALSSAIYIQSVWLKIDVGPAKPFWTPSTAWLAILGTAMFALFMTSLARYKTSHISLVGILIICGAVLVIPIATVKPDLVYTAFDNIPGLDARPGMGLILGAIITASGFMWVVRGLTQGHFLDMSIGAIVIGIEAIFLFQPARINVDFGVIFVGTLICTLCIGGLITGASPNHTHSVNSSA